MNNKNEPSNRRVSSISNGMKKTILIAGALLFFGIVPHVLAEGFVALAPIPGLTDTSALSVARSTNLASFFNNLYKFAIGMAAVLAVIQIIWGGIEIATNKDNVSKIIDSKGRILQAVLGLVLVLSPVLVFSIINPRILNLSINLPELDTTSGTATEAGGGAGAQTTTTNASGCTNVIGTSGILQLATCPSAAAGTTWGQQCTWGRLSDGPRMTLTDGTVTSIIKICSTRKNFIFLQLNQFLSFPINSLRPLVVTTDNPNNAAEANSFASICRGANIGFKTCISDDPLSSLNVPCLPTPQTALAAGASKGCFRENLTCENPLLGAVSLKCAENPNWTPFQ